MCVEVGELAPYISLGSDDVKAFKEPFPSSAELPTNKPTQMIFAFAQINQIITLGYFGDRNRGHENCVNDIFMHDHDQPPVIAIITRSSP